MIHALPGSKLGSWHVAGVLVLLAVAGLGVDQAAAQTAAPAVSSVRLWSTAPGGTYQRGDTITVQAIAGAAGNQVDGALVDRVAPEVVAVTLISAPQSGSTFVFGETIAVEVRFSEPVTVTGAPRLTLSIGSGRRDAGYASSRERVVRFRYVVQDGDRGALGAATDALALNGGTIVDGAGPTEAVDAATERRQRMLQLGLAGFGRAVATSAVEVIGRRFGPAPADSGPWQVEATLNRRALPVAATDGAPAGAFARGVAEALGVHVSGDGAVGLAPVAGGRLLTDSAFSVERGHGAGRWGFWGGGDFSGFGDELDGYDQAGSVLSGYLGADYRFVPNALAGLAASYSNLDLTSESEADGDATLQGYLVNAYPYLYWMPLEWLGVWGLGGFGLGEAELADARTTRTGGVSTWLAAVGQRTNLLSGGGLSLALKGDGFFTVVTSGDGLPATEAHAWRTRLLLEGGLEWRPGDSRLSATLVLGGRLDGGDAENGAGAEGAVELSYLHAGSGLGLGGRGRMLLLHEDQGFHDWGASAILSWTPPGPGSGLALSVAPQWGEAAGGVPSPWRAPAALLAEGSGAVAGKRAAWLPDAVELEVSYALELPEGAGRLTPFAEIGFEEAAAGRVRVGLGGSLEY